LGFKMVLKFSLLVALAAVSAFGAVIPGEEDAVFDMVQSFLAAPEQFADAFGMTRVKRSTYDREFNIAALGAHVGIKYNDPSNRLKGGSADITIDNLKKLVKQARSSKVVLKVKFDSGASPKDGLFSMSVKYELTHDAIVEKGTFTVNRELVDGKWATQIDSKKEGKHAADIIPGFSMSMKSDYKTSANGVATCSKGNKYSININRVPGKKIHAVIKGNGKTYTVDGTLDKAGKNIDVVIDAAGKIINANGKYEDTGKNYVVTIAAKYGKADYTVRMQAAKDYKKAGFFVKMGENTLASIKLEGVMSTKKEGDKIVEIKNMKYLASATIMGGDTWEIKYGMKNGDKQTHKLSVSGKKMDKIEATYERQLKAHYGRDIEFTLKKGGVQYIKYANQFTPMPTPSHYVIDVQSQFDINNASMTHAFFCKYGCFNTRSMHSNVKIDKKTPYKVTVDVSLIKDGESVAQLEINSVKSPYKFSLKAHRLLPKVLPTGRKSIEFTADHQPGHHLKIDSNTDAVKSFYVVKMPNGMRKVTLNGKELVKGNIKQGDNSITQTTILPGGMKATTTIAWAKDDMKSNDVDIKVDATNRHLDAKFKWDVTNLEAMTMFVDLHGNNPRMGDYHFKRDAKVSAKAEALEASWTGVTSVANAPFPTPIDTKVHALLNMKTNDYMIDVAKTIAGTSYGITLKNGRLSVNL